MKVIINTLKTVVTGFCAIMIFLSMAVMIFICAFPYDEELHRKAEIAKERAEKRAEGIKILQEEWMKQHK